MVDNFLNIENFLNFAEIKPDEFYIVSVMQRRKDGFAERDKILKTYVVSSTDKLKVIKNEIKTLCDVFHARAYFSVCKKSYSQVIREMMHKFTDIVYTEEYGKLHRLFVSAAESTEVKNSKYFIIDVDEDNVINLNGYVNYLLEHNIDYWINSTVTGFHIIARPFNTQDFKEKLPPVDIKKNARTLLYYNDEKSN